MTAIRVLERQRGWRPVVARWELDAATNRGSAGVLASLLFCVSFLVVHSRCAVRYDPDGYLGDK